MITSTWFFFLVSFASAALVWGWIKLAHKLSMLDSPGQRRLHQKVTPRGGGIAIVIVVIGFGMIGHINTEPTFIWAIFAMFAVAAVGLLDDLKGLSARLRLAVHLLAAALLVCGFLIPTAATLSVEQLSLTTLFALCVFILAIGWSINLHNFMDGANGMLAMQVLFVSALIYSLSAQDSTTQTLSMISFAAVLGFLPFNFSQAKVFMGDVGSGFLGLLMAYLPLYAWHSMEISFVSVLILGSVFWVDATLTLASRLFAGKKWYLAHREHLYQWRVRSGSSHAAVTLQYLAWNLFVVMPLVLFYETTRVWSESLSNAALVLYYLVGPSLFFVLSAWIWCRFKKQSLRRIRQRRTRIAIS